jgi:hypothetical protein
VFIKPIPEYLLSHAFWEFYLTDQYRSLQEEDGIAVRKAALGFMRSYFFLVRHKSDFDLAQRVEHRLVSKSTTIPESTTYEDFIEFIAAFREI